MSFLRPDDSRLLALCRQLKERANALDQRPAWPEEQLRMCRTNGVMAWFVDPMYGGLGCGGPELTEGLLALGQGCLTTTFVLTQQIAAYNRLSSSANRAIASSILPEVAAGRRSATVGISHLTTSRQHLATPALTATELDDGYVLNGYSPWVTGAGYVDELVTGAQLADGRQFLVCIPFKTPGVTCGAPADLVALAGSCTASVTFQQVRVTSNQVLEGPREKVIQAGSGGSTGGLQTSTLALALASSAWEYLKEESSRRAELMPIVTQFESNLAQRLTTLRAMAADPTSGSAEELREQCNSLVLRLTQAALSTAKGAGYVRGHPAGRWCKEALFFLVWSCPQSVVEANLCEWAGV